MPPPAASTSAAGPPPPPQLQQPPPAQSAVKRRKSKVASMISGGLSGAVVSACVQPLDVIRTRMQASRARGNACAGPAGGLAARCPHGWVGTGLCVHGGLGPGVVRLVCRPAAAYPLAQVVAAATPIAPCAGRHGAWRGAQHAWDHEHDSARGGGCCPAAIAPHRSAAPCPAIPRACIPHERSLKRSLKRCC